MESQILFGSGKNNRYDSWDMENLKYIRRKSQSNLLENSVTVESLEIESYHHESSINQFKGSDESTVFNSHVQKYTEFSRDVEGRRVGLISTKTSRPQKEGPDALHYNTGGGIISSSSSDSGCGGDGNSSDLLHNTSSSSGASGSSFEEMTLPGDETSEYFDETGETRFDDCYLLDVLTVQNASVFAETTPPLVQEKVQPFRLSNVPPFLRSKVNTKKGRDGRSIGRIGSGSESVSSISSVDDEVTNINTIAPTGQLSNSKKNDPGDTYRQSLYSTSNNPHLPGQEVKNEGSGGSSCPFCSDSSSTGSYYYLGQKVSPENIMIDETRTPSPYYVRLRRDLYNYSPALLTTPTNFGMDKQGQLVIDYSSNWAGLENYVKHLQIT